MSCTVTPPPLPRFRMKINEQVIRTPPPFV